MTNKLLALITFVLTGCTPSFSLNLGSGSLAILSVSIDSGSSPFTDVNGFPMSLSGSLVIFDLTIENAQVIDLQASDVEIEFLNGTNTNCVISIADGNTATPSIEISSCDGFGDIRFRVGAGIAEDSSGTPSDAIEDWAYLSSNFTL